MVDSNPTNSGTDQNVHQEQQYIDLVRHVMSSGQTRPDRTGTGVRSVFAPPQLRFDLSDSKLPILTTKKVFTKSIIHELLWFIKGSTDSNELSCLGVKIWNQNGSRDFLDRLGFEKRQEGDLGPIYGFQWRHFGADYVDFRTDYTGKGVDQLQNCIEKIISNPTDRRIILTAWNPKDLKLMALPPCHMFCQFYVTLPDESNPKPRLSAILYQRSADIGLGLPFNITSYALLVHMIAQITDCQASELIIQLGDAHIYNDHIQQLELQIERELCYEFPRLRLNPNVKDIDGFRFDDFEILNYQSHPKIGNLLSLSNHFFKKKIWLLICFFFY
ncbi:thymidylate synthase/dCMP hydroxymethylase domain-containing protein [Phakopsora pachyrhizi]|nr:thymidylate synthase/dCMP hydroxymethylase domain-containing protein [Phakopsora pachyrhizi]